MATVIVVGCSVTTNSITITFSDAVEQASATNPANYSVYDPPGFATPTALDEMSNLNWNGTLTGRTVTLIATSTTAAPPPFSAGDYVLISFENVTDVNGNPIDPADLSAQVPYPGGQGRIVRDVEDAISYPILTQDINDRPATVGFPAGGGSIGGGGSSSLGQLALKTVTDVLGWKANTGDPKGFIGALTQAFTLTDVEGHVESTWNPQMPAIQSDLGGTISGAQASLYMRAKDAIEQSQRLLDALYPLDPEADPEYVKALREMARSQMTQILRELGVIGLPSVLRIDTYFHIILGQNPALMSTADVVYNPDSVGGTLGDLRDTYGIYFAGNPFNNSVGDEVVITNFRVISDYVTSLLQSWISNRQFFLVDAGPAFLGTQLVLISRQFNVINETVNEVRFALDSVFIGPAERQALLLEFADPALPARFLEGMLMEIEAFMGDEAPRLLKDGGKISVSNNILPLVRALRNMVEEAHSPTNLDELPDGFRTARVRNALDDLQDQLEQLIELCEQIEHDLPPSEDRFAISGLTVASNPSYGSYFPDAYSAYPWMLSLYGRAIDRDAVILIHSAVAQGISPVQLDYYSAQRIDVYLDPAGMNLAPGWHDVEVVDPDGQSVLIADAIYWDGSNLSSSAAPFSAVQKRTTPAAPPKVAKQKKQQRHQQKTHRQANVTVGRRAAPAVPPRPPTPPPPPAPNFAAQIQQLAQQQAVLAKSVQNQSQDIATISSTLQTIKSSLDGLQKKRVARGRRKAGS